MNGFTNELHDVAAVKAAELGFAVPGMISEAASEDTLFSQVTNNAWVGGASVSEAGARVWLMGRTLGLSMAALVLSREERRMVREVAASSARWLLILRGGVTLERVMAVFEMLCGRVHEQPGNQGVLWKLGRRVSLLAYALNRGVIVREVLESFEVMGEKWGLRAENKRSAVSAAMNGLREEMVRTGHLPEGFRFWFEKCAEARLVYAQAQLGNGNRAGKAEGEALSGGDFEKGRLSRRKLDELWARAENRRLEGLCGVRGVTLGGDDFETGRTGDGEDLNERSDFDDLIDG